MEQTSGTRLKPRFAFTIAVVVAWSLAIACGDEDGTGTSAQSDSASGGDLAALQYKQGELICSCAGEGRDLCLSITWPEGRVECFRKAYNAYIDSNRPAYECAVRAVEDSNACWQAAGCDDAETAVCTQTFAEDSEACPKFDAQTRAESQACVDGE